MEAVIIFPHQLFDNHPGLKKKIPIFLVEEPRFFSAFPFHQQKLIFHRATLKNYEKNLREKGYDTFYFEGDYVKPLIKMGVSTLHCVEFDDHALEEHLTKIASEHQIKIQIAPSPGFLTPMSQFHQLFRGTKQLRFDTFYIHQRKSLNILLDPHGKPLGGRWSLDVENRKKLPKNVKIPPVFTPATSDAVKEAKAYISKKFPQNPGDSSAFNYPTTHSEAKQALHHFLKHRLRDFGDYEDAIDREEVILFHSCLSPLLNVGLLTPEEVIQETLEYAQTENTPLNSLEGFIRQVIGWREYIRGVYHLIGEKERSKNFFGHHKKMPRAVYEGTTGLIPVDQTIKKLEKHAYVHHIERLMVLGNFFLLCEIDPHDIYKWFMEYFIDAYDWVMVANVYGMSQYADGGMITTKPYFSGSNYLMKMSNYPKGEWCEIWDALFWRFMIKHHTFFESQPRLNMLCKMAEQKKQDQTLLNKAEQFLKQLHGYPNP